MTEREEGTWTMQRPIRNILFICTGNVFRSPAAEGMIKRLLMGKRIEVWSAGMLKYKGEPLSQDIIEVASGYGIDLARHKPRQVNAELVEAADLIIVFDEKQVTELTRRFKKTRNKVFTIKDYSGCSDKQDMEDLWGKPKEAYERFLKELGLYVKKCADRIEQERRR